MQVETAHDDERRFLSGCVVCVSGYSVAPPPPDTQMEERALLSGMVEQCGGVYMEDMEIKSVSFLISKGLNSEKVRHALRWGVPILSHQWLFDCLVEHRFVSINPYLLTIRNPL